ncbi:MAG TPA: LemA family protein [Candidatus Cloacimonetes bacterium]|nr:LemA family protein [Candidatus Cloacimonadota bacterium]HEX38187.1 LemA family protein [Candidatus Cloacimonadota bacterium]
MKNKGCIIAIIIVVILVIALYATIKGKYNSFVQQKLDVENSWAEIDNQYKRRADLIPNLVNTVKGYASHEKQTFTEVIEARAKATSINVDANNLNPEMVQQFQEAQAGLTQALSKLMVVVEQYPDLKANQNFIRLQDELAGTENRIAVARRRYNEVVTIYNKNISIFPNNIFAGIFNFEKAPLYKIDEAERETPEVTFE